MTLGPKCLSVQDVNKWGVLSCIHHQPAHREYTTDVIHLSGKQGEKEGGGRREEGERREFGFGSFILPLENALDSWLLLLVDNTSVISSS